MKTVMKVLGLMTRLGVTTVVLLMSQHAMAAGTDPGVSVSNTATISYDVNGNAQTPIDSNAADFLVDRRVDFTVTENDGLLTPNVVLGSAANPIDFTVTNLSNGDLDFNLAAVQLTSGDGEIFTGSGILDTDVDMVAPIVFAIGPFNDAATDPDCSSPVTFIDNLPEDEFVRVRICSDAPNSAPNGSVAGFSLEVTAADPATTANLVQTPGADDPTTVENVFANGAGEDPVTGFATERDRDGYDIIAPQLAVSKAAVVISDPFGSGKALPGAIIEYTITIDNSAGADDADAVSIEDPVDSDVTFLTGVYNGGASDVSIFDGTTTTYCVAEAGGTDTNGDGCVYDSPAAGTLTVTSPALGTVAAGETWTVSFQVEIPTT
ncbi:MAG: hypothetical protein R3288_00365 [Woeseiaceae bacterium]|nr:hypothetical protein [Woeseiaceae bacterium]